MKKQIVISFFTGVIITAIVCYLISANKTVKIEITESNKVSKYTLAREDSLRNAWETERHELKKANIQYKETIKIIYKEKENENTTIDRFDNRDSLWKVANEYIKNSGN